MYALNIICKIVWKVRLWKLYRFHKKWACMLKYNKLNCITIVKREETENIFVHNVIVVGV